MNWQGGSGNTSGVPGNSRDNPELKKQLAELESLRERMTRTLAEEVGKVQKLRLGASGHGIEGKIPGCTKEFGPENFRRAAP